MTTTPAAPMTPTAMSRSTDRPSFGLRHNQSAPAPSPAIEAQPFDRELWDRLVAMDLDDPAAETPVSKRLASEHKWTGMETLKAILEYKRFLYLTQRAGFEVTPSRPVDLVWHEHLIHTKHYWDTMCRQVLRNNLHHMPGNGGGEDSDRLQSQYARTLEAYTQAFGFEPPENIWPRPAMRKSSNARLAFATALFFGAAAGLISKVWPLLIVCVIGFFVALVSGSTSANAKSRDRGGCGSGCGGGAIGSTGCGDSDPAPAAAIAAAATVVDAAAVATDRKKTVPAHPSRGGRGL